MQDFTEVCSFGSNSQYSRTGSDNNLVLIQIQIQKYFIRHKYKGTYIDKWRA